MTVGSGLKCDVQHFDIRSTAPSYNIHLELSQQLCDSGWHHTIFFNVSLFNSKFVSALLKHLAGQYVGVHILYTACFALKNLPLTDVSMATLVVGFTGVATSWAIQH